jgi:hypothetical protein
LVVVVLVQVLRFMEAIGTEGEDMTWPIAERGWAGPDTAGKVRAEGSGWVLMGELVGSGMEVVGVPASAAVDAAGVGCGEAGAVSPVSSFEAEDDLVSAGTAAAGLAAEDAFLLVGLGGSAGATAELLYEGEDSGESVADASLEGGLVICLWGGE